MNQASDHGSKSVIYAALLGNLAIAVTKFAAGWWTGSSAMLSEGVHSLVDTCNQGLLLLGLRRAARPATARHPFGHGMEIYFWAFIVALLIFALGGAVSIYEGVHRLQDSRPIENPLINFAVLGISIVIEGLSFRVALKELQRSFPNRSLFSAVKASKDPAVFAVLCEDAAALLGLLIALAGISLAYFTDHPVFDGLASIAIGVVLVIVAAFLARETLSLITGESASAEIKADANRILQSDRRIRAVDELLTIHLGPNDILVAIAIDFDDALSGAGIEIAANELSDRLQQAHASIRRVYLRPIRNRQQRIRDQGSAVPRHAAPSR